MRNESNLGMKQYYWIIWLSISLFMALGIYYVWFKNVLFNENFQFKKIAQFTISPTTFPYEDLTIPALKKREFNSSLEEKELYANHSSYTSYITSYKSDGLKINGFLTIPNGTKPQEGWPAIVFLHGYIPPSTYKTTERYIDYVDYLARNGFVVFKIDLRGHGDSEGEATGAYFSTDYIVDTLNAYSALEHADFVNKDKIGLWGHSMSGNIVLRTMAVKPTIPASVIWAGAVYTYTDRVKYGINDNSYRPPQTLSQTQRRRQQVIETYGDFNPNNIFWKQFSAINYLDDIKGSIEIHHALDDTVVNIGYSRDLMKILDNTSIPHQLYEYPSGGHNIEGVNFAKAMERTVEFYRERL
jgi:dipeptidyl aminopeptidase/acylaminoacyl peptidase